MAPLVGKVAPRVDVRGDGGMVVAPPSRKPSEAQPYRGKNPPGRFGLAERPEWLLELCRKEERKERARSRAALRKLKDSAGAYLWQPALTEGQPETILGRPVVEMVDLPDLGASATAIIYGDWTGYRIVERIQMSVLVDPYTRTTNGITRIHATRHVGGAVLQPRKFRRLTMAAI